jgi:aspartyl-tRNA(Asn)/glutamyl-tRNA(Gln) amidotransferase subunit B
MTAIAQSQRKKATHQMIQDGAQPKAAANWLINEYFGRLRTAGLTITTGPLRPAANSAIVQMAWNHTISAASAKSVLTIVWSNPGGDPPAIVEALGMRQVTDRSVIENVVDNIVAANPDKAEQAKAKPAMLGWFVGQVMKASEGKANPQTVNDLLKAKLGL